VLAKHGFAPLNAHTDIVRPVAEMQVTQEQLAANRVGRTSLAM
jgi:hypothetical protein